MCMTHDTEIPLMSHTDKHTHISLIISEGSPYPWTLFSVLWVPQGNSWSSPVTPSMDDDEAVGGSRLLTSGVSAWNPELGFNMNPSNCTVQFSSVTQSCPTLCDPMNSSMPGLPVHHQLPEFTQTHVYQVSDAIQPSHPLSSPSPAPNPSQHQRLFQ